MIKDLVRFLLDRVAEKQQLACAATGITPHWAAGDGSDGGVNEIFRHVGLTGPHRCTEHPQGVPNMCDDVRIATIDEDFVPDKPLVTAYARHIARNDPASVLAECTAERWLITFLDPKNAPEGEGRYVAEKALRLLSLAHVNHPDYRKEWTP